MGTSKTYSRVNINKKPFDEAYKTHRRKFVGGLLWTYDAVIQDEIIKDNPDPVINLSSQHIATRQILKDHEWVVFRRHINWQSPK